MKYDVSSMSNVDYIIVESLTYFKRYKYYHSHINYRDCKKAPFKKKINPYINDLL